MISCGRHVDEGAAIVDTRALAVACLALAFTWAEKANDRHRLDSHLSPEEKLDTATILNVLK